MTDQNENGRHTHRLASRSWWLVAGIEIIATGLTIAHYLDGGQWVTVAITTLGVWFGRDGLLKFRGVQP